MLGIVLLLAYRLALPKSPRRTNTTSLTCVNYYDGDAAMHAAAPGPRRRERAGGHSACV